MRAVAVVFAGLFMVCTSDATRIAQSENRCGTSQSPNQWIDVKQDTLVAFDGQTLHFGIFNTVMLEVGAYRWARRVASRKSPGSIGIPVGRFSR